MSQITTRNPATGEIIAKHQRMTASEVTQSLEAAHRAFQAWRKTSFAQRSKLMNQAAQVLRENREDYALTIVTEMGKTLKSARAEVEKCTWVCEYYASHAVHFLQAEMIQTEASKSAVHFAPLGIILAVMPWNFPFWQVFRFAAPALMAGNAAVLKHASNVPACGNAIASVFQKAGFPAELFTHLIIPAAEVGAVIEDRRVQAVTLTGSEAAGSSVAAIAGKNIKKTVLELGGSDAYLILEDANLEQAAAICTRGRLLNAGQSCIGAKRFIVVAAIYDRFLKLFTQKMAAAKMGDPLEETTDLGPLARLDLREELQAQVDASLKAGAECVLGGAIPTGPGAYYPPTILTEVKAGMPAYHEELFGPVAAVIRVEDEKEAIEVANDSIFGLGAAVFTRDLQRGERIATEELEAGACFVNALVKSDPRLPFGGIKTSGYGRELSAYGIREFVNIKTVYVG